MSSDLPSPAPQPVVQPGEQTLSDADVKVLTEARTACWRIEQYEFAYDGTVRSLALWQTIVDFLGVVVAVIFLFLQFAVPDKQLVVQQVLTICGTGVALLVILAAIWAAMAQWKAKIDKMQRLSSHARELLKRYATLVVIRPVDHEKLRAWLLDTLTYDEMRKDPLAAVSGYWLVRGFQHIGNRHMGRGVVCGICSKEWVHESNRTARWTWIPFYGCGGCGV